MIIRPKSCFIGREPVFVMLSNPKPTLRDRSGATAIEYAMIAFFVSIAAFSALVAIGSDVAGLFSQIASSF